VNVSKALVSTMAVSPLGTPAVTWNDTGHTTVAELAWRSLGTSEKITISSLLNRRRMM